MAFLMPKVEYIGRVTRNTKAGVLTAPTPYGVGFPREANASHLM